MRSVVLVLLALAIAWPAHAQTLRDAVEAAWARQPAAQGRTARESELDARRMAARALTPEAPAVGLAHLTDQISGNEGKRESELEVSVPLWIPGQRNRRLATVEADAGQLSAGLSAARWRIAGEVREAYWQTRLTDGELQIAHRKALEAALLRRDVESRFAAGDVARLDLNQARAAEQIAAIGVAEAQARLARAIESLKALTGLSAVSEQPEEPATSGVDLEGHPALQALAHAATAASARLAQVRGETRDPPELTLGVQRGRETFTEAQAHAVFLRLRLPFATAARNQPRIAAANAEVIEARAAYELERRRVEAEIQASRREYASARDAVALAERRTVLAADTQRLAARGFTLGEFDLVTRLRAENERFDADLALERARVGAARAASKLNQAYGLLP